LGLIKAMDMVKYKNMKDDANMVKTIKFRQSLFWDVDPKKIHPEKNAQYVVERILDFGNDLEVKWMWDYYDKALIKKIVDKSRCLRSRTKNAWKLRPPNY